MSARRTVKAVHFGGEQPQGVSQKIEKNQIFLLQKIAHDSSTIKTYCLSKNEFMNKRQISGFFAVLFALAGGASFDGNGGSKSKEGIQIPDAATQIPWINQIESSCTAYKNAKNQIQASAVYKQYDESFKPNTDRVVSNIRGVLSSISTDHGGDDVYISIKIHGYRFDDQDVDKGTKVYNQAAELTEGQCVQFSGSFHVSAFTERGKVCPDEFFGELSDIRPCTSANPR